MIRSLSAGPALLLTAPLLWSLAAAGPAAAAEGAPASIREPSPSPASLAPVDSEAFRREHGTMGLFRLRLGVDAAEASGAGEAQRRPCPPSPWPQSDEHEQFGKALAASRFHEAGKALGRWRLWRAACGGAAAQESGGR